VHVRLRDIRVHYVTAGSGPTVVLLHGFPENWWSWRHQIDPLAAAGFRVVAPDLRGYNETDARGPYDLDTLRDDVVALLDHLAIERAHVVAHDWGAVVAWHLATTSPGRCATLTTVNGPNPLLFFRALRRSRRQRRRSAYILLFQLPWLPEHLLTRREGLGTTALVRRLAVDPTHFGAEELQPYADAVRKPGRASAMIDWYRHLPRALARTAWAGPPRASSIVGCPVLVVWGLDDRALGFDDLVPGTEALAPSVVIRPLAGAGHFVHEERPAIVNAWLRDFLKGS
jgi:pimeloyl-ACP methyl ester carboxylesterase